ncbi:TetR/AcrR family transcriptional regulator [Nocardia sp. NPDC127579]|uniref:TetR/AcrR family transcriptional regulator n=1 Tax=Nocardia sp. NPDC127579 TaxID=3345402 RepID=UPI00362F4526
MSERRNQILEAAVRVIAQDGVRGLRVDKLAAAAGVSTALIYYHFKDRAGILSAALEHVNHRAQTYTEPDGLDGRERIEAILLRELQGDEHVRETSIAWGELRASAAFDPGLRAPLRATTEAWSADIEALIRAARDTGACASGVDAADSAERLTALVEGLSERWHSGSLTLERARELLSGAIALELGP